MTAPTLGLEVEADWKSLQTPETYVGYSRSERFASPGGCALDQRHNYELPERLRFNHWALADGRLYQLVREGDDVRDLTLEVTFADPGVEAYVFTFG